MKLTVYSFILYLFLLPLFCSSQKVIKNNHLFIAPATLTENSVTILWDKFYGRDSVTYEILLNKKRAGATAKTNFTVAVKKKTVLI
jgi:exo-poly-alpha-galacturonosidase